MVRAFDGRPVDARLLDDLLDLARRAPSAGNCQGVGFLVLEGPDRDRFWDVTLPPHTRAEFAFPHLPDAPVLVIPVAQPDAYLARYAEPDKASTGLGADAGAWSVPYWLVDTSFATMTLLLAASDAGLGALFFGLFRHEDAVRAAFSIPPEVQPIGAVALGWPDDAGPGRPGRSAARPRRPLAEVVRRGRWTA